MSGKYLAGAQPEEGRLTRYPVFARYVNEQGQLATQAYVELARQHGIDPATMALAWVNSRDFVSSNIIGASNLTQLKTNIDSLSVDLSAELLAAIDEIHIRFPNPCP